MDPPPPPPPSLSSAAATNTPMVTQPYADSVDSSPRSRHTDSWDDPPSNNAAVLSSKLRLMCSYGGHIVPRPHDKSLCYVGGETRIIVVDRNVTLSSLVSRLSQSLLNGSSFSLKYQLPSEDLDSLISVTTDEDLENMIEEYERTTSNYQKPSRLRLFLFQQKLESSQSILESKTIKSDEWFLNALNGDAGVVMNRGFSESSSVNCLLGLDDEIVAADAAAVSGAGGGGGVVKKVQDVHSVPDSPMMETTSSFGSSSSSPSLANLPPIRVHAEESGKVPEQFGLTNISGGSVLKLQQEEGFVVLSSPPPPPLGTTAVTVGLVSGECVNRVVSDDERSDHGVPVGSKKAPAPAQPLPQKSSGGSGGVLDLPSPDSVSSDSSLTNAGSRQKPLIYQDPVVQIPSGGNRVAVNVNPVDPKPNVSDPNARVHVPQIQDSGYVLQSQLDQQQSQQPQQRQQLQQQQLQQLQQQQQQLLQQQQLQQQQQQQLQQQQYVQAGAHYIHHHPAGTVPISAYYPVYPSQQQQQLHHQQQQQQLHQQQQHQQQQQQHHQQQLHQQQQHQQQQQQQHQQQLHHQQQQLYHQQQLQQLDQQYPVYHVPVPRQLQAYNLPVQQESQTLNESPTTISSSRPQTPANPAMVPSATAYNPMRNTHIAKPEMAAAAGMYRTTTTAAQQLVQVPSSQHQQQYVGYTQVHHPSQSVAPTSAATATANYGYEFTDPAHAQIYYTQTMPSQYQTMTGTAVLPEASGQISNENIKQQIKTSQVL